MRHRQWIILSITLGCGIVLFLASIGWAVVSGVAIPDQDPTPAMVAYARFHNRIVGILMGGGVLLVLGAAIAAPVLLILQRASARRSG
jgi:uncharacterized membrane protein YccC